MNDEMLLRYGRLEYADVLKVPIPSSPFVYPMKLRDINVPPVDPNSNLHVVNPFTESCATKVVMSGVMGTYGF